MDENGKKRKYRKRAYRTLVRQDQLPAFSVVVQETDLLVHAAKSLEKTAKDLVFEHRAVIQSYINQYPDFAKTLVPWRISGPAPLIIRDMADAGKKTNVGPMAAVAGAIAEHVGRGLLRHTDDVIVENGGDVFVKTNHPTIIGIYAGRSPLNLRIGLRVCSDNQPVSICTSSGTIGHSISFGIADAVCVESSNGSLSDAAATAICNHVGSKKDIQAAIDRGRKIEGVTGIVVIVHDEMGIWGDLEVVPLRLKKG